jgi:hypothetical protein
MTKFSNERSYGVIFKWAAAAPFPPGLAPSTWFRPSSSTLLPSLAMSKQSLNSAPAVLTGARRFLGPGHVFAFPPSALGLPHVF